MKPSQSVNVPDGSRQPEDTVPFVSIFIPTKNVAPFIDTVLQSLLHLDYPKDRYEIIILDGFSTDGTDRIARQYPGVIVYQSNSTVPAFYNRILKDTRGEIIAFGDGDAVVDPQWLKILVPYLSDPVIAGAGGLCGTANPEKIVSRIIGYELKARYEGMPSTVERIATMNVIYKKRVLGEVGGFDERLGTGYDTDIGHRILHAGYLIRFDPKAVVFHYHRSTISSYFRQQFNYGKNAPALYIKQIHIAAGDAVTPFWMNIQPFIYAAILISLLLSPVIPHAFSGALLMIIFLTVVYSISAVRLSMQVRDPSAIFFFILCFIRGIAWTIGGLVFLLHIPIGMVSSLSGRGEW